MTPDVLVVFDGFARWAYGWINDFARFVDALPVSYAFGAGMLAALNPCGFIMLPSFAAFYLTADGTNTSGVAGAGAARLARALAMGALVTLAFVLTFGAVGVVITAGGRAIMQAIGWAGAAVGLALVALGGYQLATRRSLFAPATSGMRVRRSASTRGVLAFGVAYAVASLGCTLPIFMLVVGGVFAGGGAFMDSVWRFVQYALGMGVVLMVVTLGVATVRVQTTRAVSRVLPYIEQAGNALLLFAGTYLVWYYVVKGSLL